MKNNHLNFAELNEDEKEKYIEFIISNNIQFEEDSNSYTANIKVKSTRPRASQSPYETRASVLRAQKNNDNYPLYEKPKGNLNPFKLAGDQIQNPFTHS